MDEDRFSLKARRTTRIPLRIPVVVVIDDNGKSSPLDGWTKIVNVHGAKIECKHRIGMHEEVNVQVPFNGKSQKGTVVWSKSQPNESGNYEFGVELDEPDNLWGVGFPPSDWEASRESKGETAISATIELAPDGVTHVDVPAPDHQESSAETHGENQDGALSPPSEDSMATDQVMQFQDLSSELSSLDLRQEIAEPAGCITEFGEMEMSSPEEKVIMSEVANRPDSVEGQDLSRQSEKTYRPNFLQTMLSTDSPSSSPAAAGLINPTDKLSAFFNELVDSALQARVLGLIEGVGKRIERRVEEIENTTVSRIEEQIQSIAARQGDSMERRASEYVEAQQQCLEQNVRDYLADAEEGARQRQAEQMVQSKQAISEEAMAQLQTHQQQLDQHAGELVTTTQHGLRASMEQQLPGIEKDLLERCRLQGERMMAAQVEQWTLLFSDRLQNAQQSMEKRLNETLNEVISRHAVAMDAHLEEHLAQSSAHLEQQMNRIGTQVRQTFLRHIVTELGRSQQVWIQQVQRQLEKLASDNLEKSRRNLSNAMKSFGESLIQQAAVGDEVSQESTPNFESPIDLPMADSLQAVLPGSSE